MAGTSTKIIKTATWPFRVIIRWWDEATNPARIGAVVLVILGAWIATGIWNVAAEDRLNSRRFNELMDRQRACKRAVATGIQSSDPRCDIYREEPWSRGY
jgi:uncharacterized protein (DUF2062 family)